MKKFIFNDKYGLTKAVLWKQKLQTRRIEEEVPHVYADVYTRLNISISYEDKVFCPRYKVGEVVAIAQSYYDIYNEINSPDSIPYMYRRTAYEKGYLGCHKGWKNKMYVPASDMPWGIKIRKVWAERLQDITPDDCFAEGIPYCSRDEAVSKYADLFDHVTKAGTWNTNPIVIAYEFAVLPLF